MTRLKEKNFQLLNLSACQSTRMGVKMKICLVNPPSRFGRAPLPHMGIAYIAGMLKHSFAHVATDIIDCPFQDIGGEKLKSEMEREAYDLVGITTYFYNYAEVFKLVRFLNQLERRPFIILGGYYPTLHPKKTFYIPGIDCICIGEGEYVFKELVNTLMKGEDFRKVRGLAYLNDQKEFVQNEVEPLIENLDELPKPYIVTPPPYWYPLVSGRGCHGHCTFCSIVDYYSKVPGSRNRKRCPKGVVKELKEITEQYQNRVVWMMDDNFFSVLQIYPGWIDEFVEEMQVQKVRCKFKIFARADQIEEDVLRKLKSAGLIGVVVGVESMVFRQLKLYGKHVDPDTNHRALQIIQKTGIWLDMGFILLDPYTTLEELEVNLKFLRDSSFVEISEPGHELISSLGPLIVLEDTPIHRYLSRQNILSGTDVGYNYQSEEITCFHKALKLWNKKVSGTYFDFNNEQLFSYYADHGEIRDTYIRKYRQCLRIDIEFMWSIFELVRNQKTDETACNVLIDQYEKKFQAVINEKSLEEIIEAALPIFQDYCLGNINRTSDLLEEGLNSIQAVHALVKLEKKLGIKFEDEELDLYLLRTVEKLAVFVQEKYRRAYE